MASKINHRRAVRVTCGAPARAEGPRGPMKGTCTSLSQGGMFFNGPTVPVGQSIELSVELPGQGPFRAVGEVRYHHDRGMGIRFTRLAQEDLQRIGHFVSANAA